MSGFNIKAPPGFQETLKTLDLVGSVRADLERALADELISLEEDLRGPTQGGGGGGEPSGPHGLSPGEGLIPINTGRLLSSFQPVPTGLSAVMTADAQDKRTGFFYAEVAHFAGGVSGEAVDLATRRWAEMGERAAAKMQQILTDHLEG